MWLGALIDPLKMADGMPRAGLVSMLASKFGELKSSKESLSEPSAPATKPKLSEDPLQQAIFSVIEQTNLLESKELLNLVHTTSLLSLKLFF